ncbi:MAG TPA: pyridoxamine 5'-phosphate oxidase family protein [Patescibacteria group bacterium]|nr:pyridoxamine 5'-phosphate oxidase family protein [Patescibacteria group bacterium]
MSWKQSLKERQKIVLATSSRKGSPHAIVVVSLGLVDKKLLVGACLMKTTLKNIKENGKVSIAVINNSEYYRIEGQAKIYSSGKYFDEAYKKSSPPMPKAALLIDIKEVVDLDKQKKLL